MKYLQGMLSGFLMAVCFVLITGSHHHRLGSDVYKPKYDGFKIVTATTEEIMYGSIGQLLIEGWGLKGDLIAFPQGDGFRFVQMMVKLPIEYEH
jgi:hypothetical protein